MKVYLVYFEYHPTDPDTLKKVFVTKEKAEAFVEEKNSEHRIGSYYVWEVDAE